MHVRSNIVTIVCLLVFTMADEKKLQKEAEAQDWYADWVKSQENPYIMKHVRELGKKISLARGGPIDHEPVGWFKKFLIQRVRGKMFTKALEAQKGESSPSTWKLKFT
jgi:hypothetical protein